MAGFLDSREVFLNVYDLNQSNGFLRFVGLGFYHTGVLIAGKEYHFSNQGIQIGRPREAPVGAVFRESINMGVHEGLANEISAIVRRLRDQFPGSSYNVVSCNCNHFSDALCRAVLGRPIPSWVNRMAGLGGVFIQPPPSQEQGQNQAAEGTSSGRARSENNPDRRKKKELTEEQKQKLAALRKS
uniref:PPPDE domain-containing protein n=1 Tax=Fibrocapsa japonica TaxID=94617 RepID=A0A7S2UWR5_9STRA|mmetsp:Transcript_14277/g.20995  ORF Transcript_14277/g.20995 Transcript_14277/m.20995 type:complete len:185 (+) Transcript_14277:76-630(+)|eukprot:CAMPEP_0113934372 /NCGR_PEP_ID=MMETSP1339-20121228/1703_1 /TAXON_ID=94617 /ORGANISM="Fibrocapsa japonica" /LENGTH=184 /DNA_ID=CAMNT_0000936151 /DNA_START=76 /DNA_END=630 /DNA_ORIENTATION=- /assembly_acc=CAM_ASM_000762